MNVNPPDGAQLVLCAVVGAMANPMTTTLANSAPMIVFLMNTFHEAPIIN